MSTGFDIDRMTRTVVSLAYPELQKKKILISWGRTSSLGQVRWSDVDDEIRIRLNKIVKEWHPAGITGLLSHELSHPSQKGAGFDEWKTDEDVVLRGLGPYLAVERLLAGKYEDHAIHRGKDRYFGYRTIRDSLTSQETSSLDTLMSELKLKPVQTTQHDMYSHDSILHEREGVSSIIVEGEHFTLPKDLVDPDIKTVNRDGLVFVYADEILIGQYEESNL